MDTQTASLDADVESRFGVLPNFFRSASAAPGLIDQLWLFAKASYLDNPLPSVFKERLFVYLSRFCEVRYCVVRHVGFLIGHGRPAGDAAATPESIRAVTSLLRQPVSSAAELDAALSRLEVNGPLASWPPSGSATEADLFSCLTVMFTTPGRCEAAKRVLKSAVGARDFELLVGFLAFIRAAHYWTLLHPEIEIEADMLVLMQQHEELAALLLNDPDSGRCDLDQRLFDELLALRELNERQELMRAKAALEEKDRQKDAFIAILAHELRNPLATIQAVAELLPLTPSDGEEVAVYCTSLLRQTGAMARMLDDLLESSRLALGKMSIDRVDLDLAGLVREVLADARERIARSKLDVEIDVGSKPVSIMGDAVRITQAVNNLLVNAIKYTPAPGKVTVSLSVQQGWAVIKISDTGVGFAADFEGKMFTPFVQADTTLARTAGGLGLGLAISRQLVELHGGSITASSGGINCGADFTVRLPVSAGPSVVAGRPSASGTRPNGLRILVVDDNPDVAISLSGMCIGSGHHAEIAGSGAAALTRVRASPPDLILCDIGLPDMDGFAVARACRELPAGPSLFIVAVSGYGGRGQERRAIDAGFDVSVVKPLGLARFRELAAACQRRLSEEAR